MDDDDLPRMHAFDRVPIRAVLIPEGEDAQVAVPASDILEPVVIPVAIDGDETVGMGDWFTPHVTAVFEPDGAEDHDQDQDQAWEAFRQAYGTPSADESGEDDDVA
ncbi:MAG TPA: hypothetical protein VHB27_02850 [Rhodopila sp.]|uniref:hypothetical protein n=1 Tax=Rhodopila sp. TaxID=2480087 RepID=UPI002C36B18A|nr:hypothetical protein [Rhodopila sp.]HVY14141.1 hypothetical protein [Rhodopila sp.]